MLEHVERIFFKEGMSIADVTYGKGNFWKNVDLSKYDFKPSDLKTGIDFRSLPYVDSTLDIVVLDPPYAHNPGKMFVDSTYNNEATTKNMYHADIIKLYKEGMEEAYRVLKKKGLLLVKCQDEIQSAKQCWSHIEIYDIAKELGYIGEDLFVLHQYVSRLHFQYKGRQKHARKNHSYLWVFQKK